MGSHTPVILLLADELQDELRDQFAKRYAADYDLQVAGSLGEGIVLAQTLKMTGTPIAMFVAVPKLPDATGLVTLQCLHAVVPTAKRLIVRMRDGLGPDESLRQAQAVGDLDAAFLIPSGPRDEEFHTGVTELLSDWGWSIGGPVVAMITIVADADNARCAALRDFLDRQGVPVATYPPSDERSADIIEAAGELGQEIEYPLVHLFSGQVLINPTVRELAHHFSDTVDDLGEGYVLDLAIVGGGPAGLAAAVYGASEGLTTGVVEADAIGGQAGTSSMIRNYLGFPRGISGMRLAQRARFQAARFGAQFFSGTPVTGFETGFNGAPHTLHTPDGPVRARSVLIAAGVAYRRLGVESVEELVGLGVHYGAASSAARECEGGAAIVVGGGNSAGQAAIHLSRFAKSVVIAIRRDDLSATMSDYLIREIAANPRIVVAPNTEVVDAGGAGRLEWVTVRNNKTGDEKQKPACGLFLLLGAHPCCDWLRDTVERDARGFVLTGRDVPREYWSDELPPAALATSVPGIFAAGDIRAGSMKRVASAAGEGAAAVPLVHSWIETLVSSDERS